MSIQIDMVIDMQYGSTGKGAIAGWLAKRRPYDTAVCAFSTNAGHTYIDHSWNHNMGLEVMTQQLPTALISSTVRNLLIGPGAAIHLETLRGELVRYSKLLANKRILIHPHAAVVEDYHAEFGRIDGRTKMGSTTKGVGEAYIERMRRKPDNNTVINRISKGDILRGLITTQEKYNRILLESRDLLVEGAQGFSLSMYHGQYPFVTSRDVTPWQIAADCGLPFKYASSIKIIGTLRAHPIRVNNRDGSSGPCYNDQYEMQWQDLGIKPELTTVTKLPRRVFSFSFEQLDRAMIHCGHYYKTELFLNFVNYMADKGEIDALIKKIETSRDRVMNYPLVGWIGTGPDDSDIITRKEWDSLSNVYQPPRGLIS